MEKKKVEPLNLAYRLLNPGTVVIVSVGNGQRDNLYAVTWNMPVRKDPPMMALLTGKRHHSYPFIAETGEFGINIMSADKVDAVYGVGATSGEKVQDKFAHFGLTRQKPRQIQAPLVSEAVANLECRVCHQVDMGASALLIAHILEATAERKHFQGGNWLFEQGLELVHHLGASRFCVSSREIRAKPPGK
jgi:flavin reductase (DIM6/NTAB) family NADH-FMN oxidoreductase RutF